MQNEKISKILSVIIILCLSLFCISSILLFNYGKEYKNAKNEYNDIVQNYVEKTDPQQSDKETEKFGEKTEKEQDTSESNNDKNTKTQELKIDFDKLKQINPEFKGMLYIPKLNLLYPVVQTKDNNKYLKTTFSGNSNSSGCIFEDYRCEEGFTGNHVIIYGHNMKNGSMFGSLKTLAYTNTNVLDDPYVYLYSKTGVQKYRIYAFYTAPVNGKDYNIVTSKAQFSDYVNYAKKMSSFKDGARNVTFVKGSRLLTLSTCWGTSHTKHFIVQCVQVE